ncbi:hypothetical protein ACTGYW_00580 [Streptococcus suis]
MMNEINNIVTFSDLRNLGMQGGATARLDDGTEVKLFEQYGTVTKKGYVAGQLVDVEVIMHYPLIFSQIRTIKRHGILIARKSKINNKLVLKLTGYGYSRKEKNTKGSRQ